MRTSRLQYPDHALFAKNMEMESEIVPQHAFGLRPVRDYFDQALKQ